MSKFGSKVYFLMIFFSFLIVSLGQPAWIPHFAFFSAAFGFALFWKGMLFFSTKRERFLAAMIWFAAVQGVQLSWLTTMDYMGPLIIGVYLFLILAMGVQFGLISLLVDKSIGWLQILAIAGCWALFEWMRLFFLCGFTWNPTGLALTVSSYSIQFASLWGIYGLSFWVVLVNLVALKAYVARSVKQSSIWISFALFPYFFGFLHQTWIEASSPVSTQLEVVLVQTHLSPEQKEYSYQYPNAYIHPLIQWQQIIDALPNQKIDLIILPEAALPLGAHYPGYPLFSILDYFHKDALPPLKKPYASLEQEYWKVTNTFLLQALANRYNAHVIAGLDDRDLSGTYNAAFHFFPLDFPYERYEKQILVPIGEYIPFRQWDRFAQFIGNQFGIYSSFDPGVESKVFKTPVPSGISICLEETFPSLIRKSKLNGAELFVNLTNDAWFPDSKLARQHFDHGRVRAVENGVPLLRACNSGISGAIDCFGRIIKTLPVEKKGVSILCTTLPIRSYATLYTIWGDSAILGISLSAMLSYFLFRKKKLP